MTGEKVRPILALFFSFPYSLEEWTKIGIVNREIKPYKKMIEEKIIRQALLFTYGSDDFHSLENQKSSDILIIPMPKFFNFPGGKFIYSFFLPFIQFRHLEKATLFKTNQMRGSWAAVLAKLLYKKPLIVRTGYTLSLFTQHRLKKTVATLIEKFAYTFSDRAVVTSQADRQYLETTYGLKKVFVIPNYVDTDQFKPISTSKKRDIIFIGRLAKQKNLKMLLQALENTAYSLTIVGTGEEFSRLKQLASYYKLNVEFTHQVSNLELPKIIANHKIFVLPSHYEGAPKSLLEAMSVGLSCLVSNIPANAELINHKHNGYLVSISVQAFKQALDVLMSNAQLRKKLGDEARQTIINKYSLEKITTKEYALYRELVSE